MPELLDHEVLLVTGKGGVGKSTVAAALARAAAKTGKRVLLVEFESVSRAAPLFGLADVGVVPQQVDERLWVRGFETIDSLHFFALQQLKIERIVRLIMRNETVRGFFMAMPAIKSVTFLYHLWRIAEENGRNGDNKWDLVVCDLPTTGFVFGLYGVPTMVQQIFHLGPLARVATGMGDFLYDTNRVGLVMVTLPEEMPVVETIEFVEALRAKHGIRAAATIMNGVVVAPISADELPQAQGALAASDTRAPVMAGMLQAAELLLGRQQRAARLEPMLTKATAAPTLSLPHLFRRHLPLDSIDVLAQALLHAMTSTAGGSAEGA
jgi:arsenite/tail-anchored protein-transporting ATPase